MSEFLKDHKFKKLSNLDQCLFMDEVMAHGLDLGTNLETTTQINEAKKSANNHIKKEVPSF